MATIYPIGHPRNPEKRCGYMKDGMLVTWYTYEFGLRRTEGPRGGKAYAKFARNVLYFEGRFYRAKSNRNKDRKGPMFTYEPITGTIWPAFPGYMKRNGIPSATIEVLEGRPVACSIDGVRYDCTAEWPAIESYLGFDRHYTKRSA